MDSINPATGELIHRHSEHDPEAVEQRLAQAHAQGLQWAERSFAERGRCVSAVAELLVARRDALADLIVAEMGKPRTQALAEVDKCARVCSFFAEHTESFLAPEPVDVGGPTAYVAYRPLGAVLAILPWNFPLWQAFRFVAPALMAGNAVVMKPGPSVMGCGLAVEALLEEAGVPAGLVPVLTISDPRVEAVIRDPRIVAVTLTGSDRAGRAVASVAGQELKKVVLELGGSDPYLVLADADLELAVAAVVRSRVSNAGQSCIGAKRCIVEASVLDAFVAKLTARLRSVVVADPRQATTQMGPLARADLRAGVHAQVMRCVEQGAQLRMGGTLPTGPGFWYPVTLLTDVRPSMPAFTEELFGPVVTVCEARDEAHGLALANESSFGLGAAVFTRNVERGLELAEHRLDAGSCFVNDFVRSDPRLPFGGIKRSGYGRELSRHGLLEFVNVKTVWAVGDDSRGM